MINESRNIVFTGKDELEFRAEPLASLAPGQVLVQTQRSLISTGTECICLSRSFAPGTNWDSWVQYPFHAGYSNAGVVLETAPDVQTLKPGDRVAYRREHRQYFVEKAAGALLIPDGVSDEAATWFGLGTIVQNGVRRAQHALGDTVVVIGLGLLGQLTVQYLRVSGAREVIAVDTAPARLSMAQEHGATHILEMGVAEAKAEIEKITDGRMADVVYDVTGHHAVFAPALGLVRRMGKFMLLGDTGTPALQHLTSDFMTKGITLYSAHDNNAPAEPSDRDWWTRRHMAELFYTYLQRGQMEVDSLVTHRYSPAAAEEAYSMLMSRRADAMGVIFDWSKLGE